MATACTGRVGSIITRVLYLFNDEDQRFLNDTLLVAWCNECQRQIAIRGFFEKDTNISIVGGQESYDLASLVADLEDVIAVIYNGSDASSKGDDELLTPITSWQAYRNILAASSTQTRPYGYYLQGATMYLAPVPTQSLSNGITIHHSYIPSDLGCTSNTTPATPSAHDIVYVYFCLMNAYARDRHSPLAQQQVAYYQQMFQRELAVLLATRYQPGDRLRSNR